MRVISRGPFRDFTAKHPQAKAPLDAWFAEARRADWGSFADVKAAHRSAETLPGNRVIFNIGGNKYRLVAKFAYRCRTVYVRFVGTHAEYDRIDASII